MTVPVYAALIVSNLLSAMLLAVHMVVSHVERKDLYDRLMSGDADRYLRLKDDGHEKDTHRVSAHRKAIDAFHQKGTEVHL